MLRKHKTPQAEARGGPGGRQYAHSATLAAGRRPWQTRASEQPDEPRRAASWPSLRLQLGLEALALACLFLAGLRLTAGLEAVVDLGLFDETGYLYAGTHLRSIGLMPPAWAPLYGLWYFALSHIQPDPVELYYLNYRVLATVTPLLLYATLRAYGLPRLPALGLAWAFLVGGANLLLWPKPGSFALCLALLLLIAARDLRAPTRSVLLLSLGTLLCSYVRPEYLLASGLLFALYLGLLWRMRGRLQLRAELLQLAFALALAFGLMRTFGLVSSDRNNDRSFEAFAQHYAINWAAWNRSDIDPWTEYEVAIADSFGPAASLAEAARANPEALGRHLLSNLANYPLVLGQMFLLQSSPLLAPWAGPWARAADWLVGLGAGSLLAWSVARRSAGLRERLRAQGLRLTIFALLAAPALSSAIVIYPRGHYLLLHGVLLALAAGLLLGPSRARPGGLRDSLGGAGAALALVALTPLVAGAGFITPAEPYPHPQRSTVEFVRGLGISGPAGVLGDDGGLSTYLGDQFRRVGVARKEAGALAFIDEYDIGLILLSPQLSEHERLAGDPEWQALLADPGAAGFRSVVVPDSGRRILYRAGE